MGEGEGVVSSLKVAIASVGIRCHWTDSGTIIHSISIDPSAFGTTPLPWETSRGAPGISTGTLSGWNWSRLSQRRVAGTHSLAEKRENWRKAHT